ncbi:MAG TPA: penicillin-insensitive murein endopeptidase [Stellaceae bacterium]|nr:penicillin-insensitive murein endopeptidase [Stellaceae bacterium]
MPRGRIDNQCAAILLAGFAMMASLAAGCGIVVAQDLEAREAAARRALLASLPRDAAQRLFGREKSAASGPPEAIGGYSRGCLEGAVELPADGPHWEVMRPSRDRAWGHPALIGFIERLAQRLPAAGWPGLLVGDIAQPRGGPMLTGHESHQIGLDADIWLTPMPPRRLSAAEREEMSAENVVAADGEDVDRAVWSPRYRRLLEAAARRPRVARVFVNPAIKRALCREAGVDRAWLDKIRPWWGHKTHFHLRLACPAGDRLCRNQLPPPPGDGCGKELAWWFTPAGRHPPARPPKKPLRLADLPRACAALAGGRK